MKTDSYEKAQGHWILAKMGKRVLRLGGKELTTELVRCLSVTKSDNVVEFAPGLGYTASLVLANNPNSYIGIDANPDAIKSLRQKFNRNNVQFIEGNAANTNLITESKNIVFGEAMLTMHANHRKKEIIQEANRILKKGGLYAIHELGIFPNNLDEEKKANIQRDLAVAIKVNARPLTEFEWKEILENEGFKVLKIKTNAMSLLEPKRMIDDEGIWRFLKIGFNILIYSKARKRIVEMRKTFHKHKKNINALIIIAEKL